MGTEELCVRKIESGIRGIKNGTKEPKDTKCGYFFSKLKPLNEGLYEDLMDKYKDAITQYNNKNNS